MLLLILLLLSNPFIQLESIKTSKVEYLSLEDLYETYKNLSEATQKEISFGLITIYNEHPTHLNIANASVKIEYKNNLIDIDSFFQGNRLIIHNLPIDVLKSFIFMK